MRIPRRAASLLHPGDDTTALGGPGVVGEEALSAIRQPIGCHPGDPENSAPVPNLVLRKTTARPRPTRSPLRHTRQPLCPRMTPSCNPSCSWTCCSAWRAREVAGAAQHPHGQAAHDCMRLKGGAWLSSSKSADRSFGVYAAVTSSKPMPRTWDELPSRPPTADRRPCRLRRRTCAHRSLPGRSLWSARKCSSRSACLMRQKVGHESSARPGG